MISLEFLHSNGILHRDIKPENLVFDDLGYLRLTDFGIARIWKPENLQDTSGTPGYMGILIIYLFYIYILILYKKIIIFLYNSP